MTIYGKGTDDPLARVLLCPTCRLYLRCVLYAAGDVAWFDCPWCKARYVVQLAAGTVLAVPLEPAA